MTQQEIATVLDQAAVEAKATAQMAKNNNMQLTEAYDIQKTAIDLRLERGETIVGYKLGFTSKAKMEQMGVHDMIWGRLTSTMHIKEGDTVSLDRFIHPRVEPEIAFLVKKDIDKQITMEELSDYYEGLALALEIIDSRYENFKFSLEDVVADNCSSTGFVVGPWLPIHTNVSDLNIQLKFDGETKQEGNTNAILGNPLESAVEMTRLAIQNNITLKKGDIILAGAATAAEFLKPNTKVSATFETIGDIQFNIQ
ncbi:MAG: fumarylacetoacetate hydrolase family protein [Flavobacteriaceae bacterium]|nr:fumarylacetoacetate hydrolase family protein [Flavobacteriaceae bacterium]